MRYAVLPGLYAAGRPGPSSPVLVTANYKLTFDRLRVRLDGIDAWILVLDTQGINVWCAAGKGTFGTEELVRKIQDVGLDRVVGHRILVLPQLGAPGVAAHDVRRETGFRVEYGPVDAKDIPRYLADGCRVRPGMRRVRFPLKDRLALIPLELIQAFKFVPIFLIWVIALRFIRDHRISGEIIKDFIPYLTAFLGGSVLFQILLPWLPFRSFLLNGWLLGMAVIPAVSLAAGVERSFLPSLLLMLPPVTAYIAFNFTGATTYTSLSGVRKELARGLPALILSVVAGMVLQIVMIR